MIVEQVVLPTYAVLSATYKAEEELLKDICGCIFAVVIAHCFASEIHHRKIRIREAVGVAHFTTPMNITTIISVLLYSNLEDEVLVEDEVLIENEGFVVE